MIKTDPRTKAKKSSDTLSSLIRIYRKCSLPLDTPSQTCMMYLAFLPVTVCLARWFRAVSCWLMAFTVQWKKVSSSDSANRQRSSSVF